MKHRYDRVKHFFTDIFTDGQIERAFRYEPAVEDDKTAADKAADIAEKYTNMEFEQITPRTDREIKREIRAVLPKISADMKPVRHIPEEGRRITE